MATSMQKFNCETLALSIEFDEKDFNKTAFRADLGQEKKRWNSFSSIFGSEKNRGKEHSHLNLQFNKNESSLKVVYHKSDRKVKDSRPPYMEDCMNWIGGFFRKDNPLSAITAIFEFDETFESIVPLTYPLHSRSAVLAGALVSGMTIDFPPEAKIDRASIQVFNDRIVLFINTENRISLKNFDLYKTIKNVGDYSKNLVKKVGAKS